MKKYIEPKLRIAEIDMVNLFASSPENPNPTIYSGRAIESGESIEGEAKAQGSFDWDNEW